MASTAAEDDSPRLVISGAFLDRHHRGRVRNRCESDGQHRSLPQSAGELGAHDLARKAAHQPSCRIHWPGGEWCGRRLSDVVVPDGSDHGVFSGVYLALPQLFSIFYLADPADRFTDQWLYLLSELHFGRFNLVTEWLWAVLGFVPGMLAFTGTFICCRRIIFGKPSNPWR